MERVRNINNHSSGRQNIESKIDQVVKLLLDGGYTVGKFFTEKKDDATTETIKTCASGEWDIIIACGGDGTVNEVATGIVKSSNKLPVAIIAGGTMNDFANYINMPTKMTDFFQMIKNKEVIDIDLGQINEGYFVNVASGGLLTDVGSQAPIEAKTMLGRVAYYLEGLRMLIQDGIEPVTLDFQSDEYSQKVEVLLFFVSNSSSIGGFKKLSPDANIADGLLDVLIIKESTMVELANIFFAITTGDHINHPKVDYFKTKEISVQANEKMMIDTDGEVGKKLPAHFKVIPKGMKIIINNL